jgi:hypothetical protein
MARQLCKALFLAVSQLQQHKKTFGILKKTVVHSKKIRFNPPRNKTCLLVQGQKACWFRGKKTPADLGALKIRKWNKTMSTKYIIYRSLEFEEGWQSNTRRC